MLLGVCELLVGIHDVYPRPRFADHIPFCRQHLISRLDRRLAYVELKLEGSYGWQSLSVGNFAVSDTLTKLKV